MRILISEFNQTVLLILIKILQKISFLFIFVNILHGEVASIANQFCRWSKSNCQLATARLFHIYVLFLLRIHYNYCSNKDFPAQKL